VAAQFFDHVVVREDENPRGRTRGETAALVEEGVRRAMRGGARCASVEIEVDEMTAALKALELGEEGGLVVLCVDRPSAIWTELQRRQHGVASS
jgi:cyanophycin synthetase